MAYPTAVSGPAKIGGLTINNPLALKPKPAPTKPTGMLTVAPTYNKSTPKPMSTLNPAPTNSGGGTGSTYDPVAAAAAAKAAQAQADYNSLRGTTLNSITSAINQEGRSYNSSLLDYLDAERIKQQAIDAKAVQNELARTTGQAGVLDMIGHGIKSGGVILANKNATTSSAADAIARAYGDIGRRELSGVLGQYEQGQNDINQSQTALEQANTTETRHAKENKSSIINSIVSDAVTRLTALNQAAASANLPDRINIENKKAEIASQAMGRLSAFDNVLRQGLAKNAPTSLEARRAAAAKLSQSGVAPDNAFQFTTTPPPQFQGTGPFANELPVYAAPPGSKDKNQQNSVLATGA